MPFTSIITSWTSRFVCCVLYPVSIMTPAPLPSRELNAPYLLPSPTALGTDLPLYSPSPIPPSPCASIPPPALAFSSSSPVLYLRRWRACGSPWPALSIVTPPPILARLDWPLVTGRCASRASCGGAVYDYPLYCASPPAFRLFDTPMHMVDEVAIRRGTE
ncbi:hypothetical protein BV20DRAFT_655672 [Pilatotrama ljubarskyi]|nr:hypothetical protein BV20DRAFT_655672 [Pilatotrama ljubarskyi]